MRRTAASVKRSPLKFVKELDAFPKIEESYVETSSRSGGMSILMVLLIVGLVTSEIYAYSRYQVEYTYSVDDDADTSITLNLDMTIKMDCGSIGADLLDLTGKHAVDHENNLEEIATVWEMNDAQKAHMVHMTAMSQYIRQQYHTMHDRIWDKGYSVDSRSFPERPESDRTPKDSCRLKGKLHTRKLSGNFHVTLGKSIPMMGGGHLHLSFGGPASLNFSHRIHHFSFGEQASGRVHPLDGDELISESGMHIYQYYLKIVPTRVSTLFSQVDTYQFAVTEQDRPLNHAEGSHGTPGIFMKYDISPIKVTVEHKNRSIWKFIIRQCGIIGGVFACAGIINSLMDISIDLLCCRLEWGKYKPKPPADVQPVSSSLLPNNGLNTVAPPSNVTISGGAPPNQ